MKIKIIILIVVILAGVIAIFTIFSLNKKDALTIPAPEPVVEFQENAKEYTLDEVSTHNSAADCWAVVRKNVYDLGAWIEKHPGGSKAILGLCGKDGTAAFENQHGGKENPEKALLGFEIGVLKN